MFTSLFAIKQFNANYLRDFTDSSQNKLLPPKNRREAN